MSTDPLAIAKLTDALAAIPDGIAGLRADVHQAEAARRKANRLNTFLLALAVVLVAVVGVVGWQAKVTNDRLVDCTTPGGKCYAESQKRTGAAVAAIARISIYVSQCGRLWPGESGPAYDRKVEACVMDRLAQAQASVAPQPSGSPR